jgi:hypothetical protein
MVNGEWTMEWKKVKLDEEKIGKYTMQTTPGRRSTTFCVVDGSSILIGPAAALRRILARDKPAALSPGLRDALALADFSQPIAVAVNLEKLTLEERRQFNRIRAGLERLLPEAEAIAAEIVGAGGQIGFGSAIQPSATFLFKRADDGAQGRDVLKKAKEKALRVAKEQDASKAGLQFLESLEVGGSGVRASIFGRIENAKIIEAIKEISDKEEMRREERINRDKRPRPPRDKKFPDSP